MSKGGVIPLFTLIYRNFDGLPLLNYLEEVNQAMVMTLTGALANGSYIYDVDLCPGLPSQYVKLICGATVLGTGLSYDGTAIHKVRLPLHDIESVSLLVNGQPVETIVNYNRTEEIVSGYILPQYEFPIFFNKGMPLNTIFEQIKIRIIFWRQPVSSFLIGGT